MACLLTTLRRQPMTAGRILAAGWQRVTATGWKGDRGPRETPRRGADGMNGEPARLRSDSANRSRAAAHRCALVWLRGQLMPLDREDPFDRHRHAAGRPFGMNGDGDGRLSGGDANLQPIRGAISSRRWNHVCSFSTRS